MSSFFVIGDAAQIHAIGTGRLGGRKGIGKGFLGVRVCFAFYPCSSPI